MGREEISGAGAAAAVAATPVGTGKSDPVRGRQQGQVERKRAGHGAGRALLTPVGNDGPRNRVTAGLLRELTAKFVQLVQRLVPDMHHTSSVRNIVVDRNLHADRRGKIALQQLGVGILLALLRSPAATGATLVVLCLSLDLANRQAFGDGFPCKRLGIRCLDQRARMTR